MNKTSRHRDHLSREEMQHYLEARCSDSEMHSIERHLLHCEFCQEAVEGFENANIDTDFDSSLSSLDKKLEERIHATKRKGISVWRVAAIALLLIVSGYFINVYLFDSSQMIQTSEKKVEEKKKMDGEKELKKVKEEKEGEKGVEVEDELEGEKEVKETKYDKEEISGNRMESSAEEIEIVENSAMESLEPKADSFEKNADVITEEDAELEEVEIVTYYSAPLISKDSVYKTGEIAQRESEQNPSAVAGASSRSARAKRSSQQASFESQNDSEKMIYGVISDEESDEAIPYVVVENIDKDTATITDIEGNYQIEAEKGDQIVVRSIGYSEQTVSIEDQSRVNVSMKAGVDLDEVIVEKSKKQRDNTKAAPTMGKSAYQNYLKENLVYPDSAKTLGINGKVTLEFTIDQYGNAIEFEVVKGLGFGCDKEAIRLIREGPVWTPAMKDGAYFEERVRMKINFK